MKVTWMHTLAACTLSHVWGQGMTAYVPVSGACMELNETVMTQMSNGQLTQVELALTKVLTSVEDRTQESCRGIVLNNVAARMAVAGRIADAERYAERSVLMLEGTQPPNDVALLRSLQILVAVRIEQGKTARAREALQKMQLIRIQTPEDRALVNGMSAAVLQAEGRRSEAETEFLAAIHAWEVAGQSETADAGAILYSLGSLYVEERRLAEAQEVLDRAFAVFNHAKDAVSTDRIKLLHVRAVLCARQGKWREAEEALREALSLSDREGWVNPVALRSLLTNYAYVLRKNHHVKQARSIEARAAAIQTDHTTAATVDITDLLSKSRPTKK